MEERRFDQKSSRIHNIWTYLIQQDDTSFVLKKQIFIDHRIWNLTELIEMSNRNGWEFKAVYPGFGQPVNIKLTKAKRLLFIGKKPK